LPVHPKYSAGKGTYIHPSTGLVTQKTRSASVTQESNRPNNHVSLVIQDAMSANFICVMLFVIQGENNFRFIFSRACHTRVKKTI